MRRVVTGIAVALAVSAAVATARDVRAAAPVDIRGTWSGNYVASIGTFPNTYTFTSEDFGTGAVSGTGNGGTYVATGTVTGSSLTFTASTSGYSATLTATISADGLTMSGTGHDTNGRTGTFTFTRSSGPVPSVAASAVPAPAAGCTFGGAGGNLSPFPAAAAVDPSVVRVVPDTVAGQALLPDAIAIDTGDPRGRVFVTHFLSRSISVIGGRPLAAGDIAVQTSVDVGGSNTALAVDSATGRVFVADQSQCQVVVLDGRAATPTVTQTISVPGNPDDVAFDPFSGRLFVTISLSDAVLAYGPDLSAAPTTISIPGAPRRLAVDGARGFIYVAATTVALPGATATGTISTIDDRGATPVVSGAVAASTPTALAVDPVGHGVVAVELGSGVLTWFAAGADGGLVRGQSTLVDPDPTARSVAAIAVLPDSREVFLPLATATRANLYAIGSGGGLTFNRSLEGVVGGVGVAVDPSTGRVFVAELRQRSIAVVELGQPVVAAVPALAAALPGPLDVSLAPQDVARSVGIVAILMLLLGAPTPLFNSTLSAKRRLIERWFRRKLPRRVRSMASGGSAARGLARLSKSWPGFAIYLALVSVLYAFLDPGFPSANAVLVLGMTLAGIAIGTAVSQVPAELYVRRRYGQGGRISIALWTLGLALGCVLVTRVASVQPGYIYGIIGGFTFTVALTADDHGRMAFRGTVVLLGVGFAAWFLRIPFQPTVGLIGGEVGTVGNSVLAAVFVSAVQGTAIGLIPLRFLTGETLFAWNRLRWAILWALALLLFAHVILYPVSSFEPRPSAAGLWTVAIVVAVYGGVALAFWGFFARRDRRRQHRPPAKPSVATP
ncbi:MAG TPA: FGLLP motif-containing membrane protein [Candidatus Limnocylindrales bacterium]|nr:FGLLP motif-containing membrane protein [Candidatus Limnocylindrales bacterium]